MAEIISRNVIKKRDRMTDLPLYHSGLLWKKYTGEKDFKKFFAELRGSTIFLYPDRKTTMNTDRLELENLVAMEMDADAPLKTIDPPVYTLSLLNEEVKLKVTSRDAGEKWKSYILTVAKKEVPRDMNLLHGQIVRLEEVLKLEKKRVHQLISDYNYVSPLGEESNKTTVNLPVCFYEVSREEAEQMLQNNPEYGSIILRPSTERNSYAITARQTFSRGPVTRHYKVHSSESQFVIELDKPVMVPSLNDVVLHFIKETNKTLQPFVEPKPYDTRIEISDNDQYLLPE